MCYIRLERGTFTHCKEKKGELYWSDLVLIEEGIPVMKSAQKNDFICPEKQFLNAKMQANSYL
ncbi:hypothetical protein FM107_06235 [Sphingobacterium sp. JB170]|nr:hypothetical protein FM107_06235 [Sphingobacterium sp. JB170]